jgi:tetratricopeptide (TPR) repeat protein
LLVLDDLQWAGPDALDLLAHLLRTASGERQVRVIGAFRDTEVHTQDPLSVLAADLARDGLADRMLLAPLSTKDTAELLDLLLADLKTGATRGEAGPAYAGLRQRLLQRTNGVPYFLVSYVQGLRSGALGNPGSVGVSNPRSVLPWSVSETIRQRVAILPPAAQEVLEIAAVSGRGTPHTLLMAVALRAGHNERAVLAGLEAACHARLLTEASAADYAFPHDLIRETVEASVTGARRALLHRQIAEALEQGPSEPRVETLAYHYSQSGAPEKAALYLERAGDHARDRFAHAEALGHYELAVERLDELGRATDAARIRESLAAVLSLLGQYDVALAALARAEHVYAIEHDMEGLRRVASQEGWVHVLRGHPEEGLALVLPHLEPITAQRPSQGLATLYLTLAALYFSAGRYSEQQEAAGRAAALAETIGDDHTWLRAQARVGQALHLRGRLGESLHLLTVKVIPRLEASGDLTTLWRALDSVCTVHAARGDFQGMRASLNRGREVAERLGDPAPTALFMLWRGDYEFYEGDWKRASEQYQRAAEVLQPLKVSRYSAYPPQRLGSLWLAQGNWEAAAGTLNEAERLARQTAEREALLGTQYVMAERDLLAGLTQAAHLRLVPLFETIDYANRLSLEGVPLLAWTKLELGEVAQAEALLEQATATMRGFEMLLALVEALRVQALLFCRGERWQDAVSALAEALEVSRAVQNQYGVAKVLYVYGLLHVRRDEMERARERFEGALTLLNRLGERLYAEHVERALAL